MTVQNDHRPTRDAKRQKARQRRRLTLTGAWTLGILVLAALIVAGLLTSRPQQTATANPAPPFTLTTTDGQQVSLSDYTGTKNVLLYFSEGAGCQACLVQMAAIEKQKTAFDATDTVVLPIVMNSKEQIVSDMTSNGVTTPFLLDDGTVSTAYGTIGKGMHGGLPGHSFVLIDKSGTQRWYGEYPSMWLAPDQLLQQVQQHLSA